MSKGARLIQTVVLSLIATLGSTVDANQAWAHAASTAYGKLTRSGTVFAFELQLSLLDLEMQVGVDSNSDGQISWGEVKTALPLIKAYVAKNLRFTDGNVDCRQEQTAIAIARRSDGNYLDFKESVDCSVAKDMAQVRLDYRLFFDRDRKHRLFLTNLGAESVQRSAVNSQIVGPDTAPLILCGGDEPAALTTILDFIKLGIVHIWSGFDHLLFLLALLIPSVLPRGKSVAAKGAVAEERWIGEVSLQSSLRNVIKVVTAFTVAHSVTLSLAALGICNAPARLTESLIAGSVVLAAANNLKPVIRDSTWKMALLFGFIHGFGFASALADISLPVNSVLLSLFSFNVGVELGQLAVVSVFFPLAFVFRRTRVYRLAVVNAGSFAVAVVALLWLLERSLNVTLL